MPLVSPRDPSFVKRVDEVLGTDHAHYTSIKAFFQGERTVNIPKAVETITASLPPHGSSQAESPSLLGRVAVGTGIALACAAVYCFFSNNEQTAVPLITYVNNQMSQGC